jgi:hypothetical protein
MLIARLAAELSTFNKIAEKQGGPPDSSVIPENTQERMRASVEEIRKYCEGSLLDSGADQAKRILAELNKVTIRELNNLVCDLSHRIEDQLKRRVFYQLKPAVANLFTVERPFGDAVWNSFPSARYDLQEACKCLACERYTATVFHLMRPMESALRCLATKLHVHYYPGWSIYLKRIDIVLKSGAKRSRLRKARVKFLSESSVRLWAIKDAWRDDTMHLESQYGPDQAKAIFDAAKGCMEHFATGLSE